MSFKKYFKIEFLLKIIEFGLLGIFNLLYSSQRTKHEGMDFN